MVRFVAHAVSGVVGTLFGRKKKSAEVLLAEVGVGVPGSGRDRRTWLPAGAPV